MKHDNFARRKEKEDQLVDLRYFHLRVGGEVDTPNFRNAGLSMDNDNDPLAENLPSRRSTTTNVENECTYREWCHSCICHRTKAFNSNTLPQLKVNNPTNFNRVQLTISNDILQHV